MSRTRTALRRAAVLVAVVAVLAFSSGTSSAAPGQSSDGVLPANGDWSELETTWATNFIRQLERDLPEHYSDPNAIEELGFVDIGPIVPGGYRHFVNVSWMADGHILNPRYPESIVYQRTATGDWDVVAAMFFLWPTATMDTIPDMVRWLPGWHTHPELCSDAQGRVVGTPLGGDCPPGSAPVTTPMMHGWIVDNECGHRFGGLDGGGLHCDYEHDHH
ncbi:MAG TPA: hypothetical protein VIL48_16490 [Acidimicrobiales bacterium]